MCHTMNYKDYFSAVTSFNASPIKTVPAIRFRIFWAFFDWFNQFPRLPARIAIVPKTNIVDSIKIDPSMIICKAIGPFEGSAN